MSREFIAIAIMGIDQHENGEIAVARVLREAQMKVGYYGKFQTPKRAVDVRFPAVAGGLQNLSARSRTPCEGRGRVWLRA